MVLLGIRLGYVTLDQLLHLFEFIAVVTIRLPLGGSGRGGEGTKRPSEGHVRPFPSFPPLPVLHFFGFF